MSRTSLGGQEIREKLKWEEIWKILENISVFNLSNTVKSGLSVPSVSVGGCRWTPGSSQMSERCARHHLPKCRQTHLCLVTPGPGIATRSPAKSEIPSSLRQTGQTGKMETWPSGFFPPLNQKGLSGNQFSCGYLHCKHPNLAKMNPTNSG